MGELPSTPLPTERRLCSLSSIQLCQPGRAPLPLQELGLKAGDPDTTRGPSWLAVPASRHHEFKLSVQIDIPHFKRSTATGLGLARYASPVAPRWRGLESVTATLRRSARIRPGEGALLSTLASHPYAPDIYMPLQQFYGLSPIPTRVRIAEAALRKRAARSSLTRTSIRRAAGR
jgi:hypothetical protein